MVRGVFAFKGFLPSRTIATAPPLSAATFVPLKRDTSFEPEQPAPLRKSNPPRYESAFQRFLLDSALAQEHLFITRCTAGILRTPYSIHTNAQNVQTKVSLCAFIQS